jgi:hypothetical protein
LAVCLIVAAGSGDTRADQPIFSGPQPGERLTPFRVLDFSGPDAGKEVQLFGRPMGAPTLLVFVHEITRPALQLVRPLDLYASKLAKDGLACHFVWLSADKTQTERYLNQARGSLALRSPASISLDGAEGPGNYGLNRKVTLTVLVAKDDKVVANFAIVQPNETDAPPVLQAVARLFGKQAPTLNDLRVEMGQATPMRDPPARPAADMAEQVRRLQQDVERLRTVGQRVEELQKQVADLTTALNEARAKIAKLEGAPAPAPLGPRPASGAGLPGRTPSDPELVGLMRQMIQPANDEARVRDIAEQMKKWAGDDGERKTDLAEFCKRIVHLKYGTEAAQKALKQLAGD